MTYNRGRSPVAVIGFSFRMPGAEGEALWDALLAGRDLVGSVAEERWAQEPFLNPRKSEPGTSYTFAAGSIGRVGGFDAGFFGISPREAAQMDPQQRVLLEMAWEAFEHAGIRPASMRGSRCGVYVGLSSLDYAYRHADDLGSIDSTTMTGNAGSIAANRISYAFDLRGPSMTVDTACSSSLVALHQACQSLREGETDAAVVGAISLHLHPYGFIGFSKASMLSRRGRCSVFDAAADGYVRSEGGGIVLLKPLARALADGNRILALIEATGVNSDGRKSGLTVPSHGAQAALLNEVYERAGIAPGEIDYFEAHGTGTAVGDPLEARAIGEAIGRRRTSDNPLPIGSVKGNVGHLEAAAGMAGLVKALHVLRERLVPPNIHLQDPNPNIDFSGLNLTPVTERLALDAHRRLVVGVSSFGFGGTNAHAVLTSFEGGAADVQANPPPNEANAHPPLLLSARSPAALRDSARQMAQHLRVREDVSDYDIAYSAALHRDIHAHRLAARAPDREALALILDRFAESGDAPGVSVGKYRPEASAPAFVYSGNASQWAGMGIQLLEESTVFREAVEAVDALYAKLAGRSIIADLRAPAAAGRFALTEVAQPALLAIQVGLTQLLEREGVRPMAVCGHSVGEVAAAWASGALSLAGAVRLIHERSAHQASTRGTGCMTAVALGAADAGEILTAMPRDHTQGVPLTIAAVNSPQSVTVSGDIESMSAFEAILTQRRVTFQRLALDYAFHSPAMDPIRSGLTQSLRWIALKATRIPMISSVTGAPIGGIDLRADYWWRNVRDPVQFDAAIRALQGVGANTFVEIGPRAVLTTYLHEICKPLGAAALVVSSLNRNEAGYQRIRALISQLELSGSLGDPSRHFPVRGRYVDLPHYPWQREQHWLPGTVESLGLLARRIVHPLLGYALAGEPLHWENHIDVGTLPIYADHAVGGGVVFPAAGFVEMALAAGRERRRLDERADTLHQVIEDLEILAPLLLEQDRSRTVRLRIDAADGRFTIVSRDRTHDDPWRTHATGRLVEDCVPAAMTPLPFPARKSDIGAAAHYDFARTLGLHYGPAFRSVDSIWFCREGVLGAILTPPPIAAECASALLHPAFLDGAFQLLANLGLRDLRANPAPRHELRAYLPVRIDRFELLQPHAEVVKALAAPDGSHRRSSRSMRADFMLYDASDMPVAIARGVRFRAAGMHRGVAQAARWITTRAVPMPRRSADRAEQLPAVAELATYCAERLHAPARAAARRRFSQEIEPLLDALCTSFAARGVRELAGEQPIDLEALVESGRLAATSAPMLRNLLQIMAEDGLVQEIGKHWLWYSNAQLPEPHDIWASLIADYPEYAQITARVGASGLHLAERLHAGATDTLATGANFDGAAAWVDGCTQQEAAEVAEAMGGVLRYAVAAQPAHTRLRVLRLVGAPPPDGIAVLPALNADRCDVVIGAASQRVLDDVRSRWSGAAALPCHIVDLDRTEPSVDALGGRFDIVVLGEGLADAPEPARRLQSARRLLLDLGLLAVLEQHTSRAADLVYGMDPNWWLADGDDSAVRSRLRTPEVWSAALTAAGFEEIETVRDTPDAPTGPYLLIARAGARPKQASAPRPATTQTWLLLRDESGYSADLGAALAVELEMREQRIVTIVAAPDYVWDGANRYTLDPGLAAHWDRLLADMRRTGSEPNGWIHLAGLNLDTAHASPDVRAPVQELRAAALMQWLQACARHALRPDCWIVAAQAGLALLAQSASPATGAESPDGAQPDRLRDAPLWGMTRVAIQEFSEQRIRWADLADPVPCAPAAVRLAQELLEPDAEDEIILTASGRYVPRLRFATAPPRPAVTRESLPHVQLDCSVPGPFRNLRWRHAVDLGPLAEDEVEIDVHAAGLNFRDVMYAMGLLPDEAVEDGFCGPTLGMEVSGVVTRVGTGVIDLAEGDAVIAFAPASFSDRVRTRALAVTRKPASWSFAAAATVPTAFFTAYYALHELAHLRAGERVLIHGAAGGVGIAAIQLAKHLGAEIIATAGTDEKRDFVRLLGADHVFDSRSTAFGDEILRATGGTGVDVVLNSLAGEAIARNLRLLRPFGRMLELGKRDFYENSRIGLRPFRNNIAYFGIDADQLLAQRPAIARRVFVDLMALFADGTLHPLPYRTFCASDIATAFRHMQASRHIGKVVVTFPEHFDPLGAYAPESPPVQLRPDGTYLITGGLSGLGLRTAAWLVRHGARHLALLSRRGAAAAPEAEQTLAEFAAAGVSVMAPACDVADAAVLRGTLALIDAQMPPLRGVVHAAMVIEDALIRDMNRDQLHRVLAPKIQGAMHLHEATRARPLDFFLLYSSATTLFGNPGQAAYVAANTALEALAAERRALGLPATCVGWGPIGDAGYLARNERVLEALVGRLGGQALTAEGALGALETLWGANAENVGYLDLDWGRLSRSLPAAHSPKFKDLARFAAGGERGIHGGASAEDLRRWLDGLSAEELNAALTEILRAELAEILRIAPERIEPGASLLDMGMDSLMAVELATSIESRLGIEFSALALSGGPTIESIVERVARMLHPGEQASDQIPGDGTLATQVQVVAAQHAGEVSEEAAAEFTAEMRAAAASPRSLTGGQRT